MSSRTVKKLRRYVDNTQITLDAGGVADLDRLKNNEQRLKKLASDRQDRRAMKSALLEASGK